ncbi:MAG: HAD family hydrolase [Gemmatimonadaceae bacterium]
MGQQHGKQNQPDAVILDVDGTLIASNDAHARAYVDAAREMGREMSFEKTRRAIGMGGDKLLPEVLGVEEDSAEGERITTRKKEIFGERYLPTLRPTPGARALLQRLRDDAMKLVVASSASEEVVLEARRGRTCARRIPKNPITPAVPEPSAVPDGIRRSSARSAASCGSPRSYQSPARSTTPSAEQGSIRSLPPIGPIRSPFVVDASQARDETSEARTAPSSGQGSPAAGTTYG